MSKTKVIYLVFKKQSVDRRKKTY